MEAPSVLQDDKTILSLVIRVFGCVDYAAGTPIALKVCNLSSFSFYVIQAFYSAFLLGRLCRVSERKPRRSKTMIFATCLILYSSVVLAVLFGYPKMAIEAESKGSQWQ